MEKKYINGLSIKKKVFPRQDGGQDETLFVGINLQQLVDELKDEVNAKGWVNISIAERKSPSNHGHTHYAKLLPERKGDWVAPETRQQLQIPQAEPPAIANLPKEAPKTQDISLEDIPFNKS